MYIYLFIHLLIYMCRYLFICWFICIRQCYLKSALHGPNYVVVKLQQFVLVDCPLWKAIYFSGPPFLRPASDTIASSGAFLAMRSINNEMEKPGANISAAGKASNER